MSLGLLAACGAWEVGLERSATPTMVAATATATEVIRPEAGSATVTPTPTPTATRSPATPTADADEWSTYENERFGVSLRHPYHWLPVPGEESRHEGEDGFFALDAMSHPDATLDELVAQQVEHKLRPYGAQPTVEALRVQGQEARMILPSADAGMRGQAALIAVYPVPIQLGELCPYFVLYADQEHIRALAETLRFQTDGATSGASGSPWGELPPGLVYRLSGALWVVDAAGEPVQVSGHADALLSPDGRSLIHYDLAEQDPWLLDRAMGTGLNLTHSPEQVECCFEWWPQRPGAIVFGSLGREVERGPGVMGHLAAVQVDGTGYQVLDAERDIGPGGFALSPDGATIAYGGGETGWLYRWDVGSEPFDPVDFGLVGTKGVQVGSPAWSPDGTKLAWVVGGGFAGDGSHRLGIGVFDLEAQAATLVHPYIPIGIGGWPPAPAWSPDGRWLAFEVWARDPAQAGVWVVQVDGLGEEAHRLGAGSRPIWSPYGAHMAFQRVSRAGERAIWVVESSKREVYPLGLPPDAVLVDWIIAPPDLAHAPARALASEPTREPTATPAADGSQILSFEVAPTEIDPGDVVTLSWEARGEQASLCPSAHFALFAPDDCWQVSLSGTTTYTIPLETGGNRAIDFLLTVDGEVWQRSVAFKCARRWFYSDRPQAGVCPLDPISSHAVAQRFERGTMIWVEQLGRTIVLEETALDDKGVFRRVGYARDPLDRTRDSSADVVAPDGLYAPTGDFGTLWRGDVAGLPGYRESLGWALAPAFDYETIWQCDDALPSGGRGWQTCSLQGPEGEAIILDPLDRWYLWDQSE